MTTGTDFTLMERVAAADIQTLKAKGISYGDSWKKRGGVGAFMMLARKWDRLEIAAEEAGWDILEAALADPAPDGTLDDIADLRRYLFLVETEVLVRDGRELPDSGVPGMVSGQVLQDTIRDCQSAEDGLREEMGELRETLARVAPYLERAVKRLYVPPGMPVADQRKEEWEVARSLLADVHLAMWGKQK